MDTLNKVFPIQENEYMKVNISLYKCSLVNYPDSHYDETFTGQSGDDSTWAETTTSKPPLLKNILGDNLFSSLQGLFADTDNNVIASESVSPREKLCHVINSIELPVFTLNSLWVIGLVLSLILTVCTIPLLRKCLSIVRRCLRSTFQKTKLTKKNEEENVLKINETDSDEKITDDEVVATGNDITKQESNGIHLSYQCRVLKSDGVGNASLITFLEQTTDKLFKKLDKLLLRGLSEGQSISQTCPATPRLARRNITRRPRIGSSPMLNSLTEAATAITESKESEEQDLAWCNFKRFSASLQWQYHCTNLMKMSPLERSSQKLLHYYERVCPIPKNMWKTACLVTDYVLYLISLEMQNIESKLGYKFIQFLGTGSMNSGTKISRVNQFDIRMVVQPPVMPELVFDSSEDSIPPGMVVISVDSGKRSVFDRKLVSNCELQGTYRPCLSAQQCGIETESMLEECLHSLYTRSRSAMDQLPFQIKGAPTGTLSLNINTRVLIGFGEPEIKLNILPVLLLPCNGWYQQPMLYVTPLSMDSEMGFRSERRHNIDSDLLWQVEASEFDSVFMVCVDSLMKHANVNSCHQVCLMVLKALLSRGVTNNLLDRGVLPSYHISTVINFLLLESAPSQWTFDKLADRFSDAIHFLQSAYGCNRLPQFMINNPHLISKMPAVAENKILTQKKQQNLLTDVRTDIIEKRLEYMKSCLRDAGLADCVKDEFSNDMWEFEFFLFN